jgi:hypothetical protein
MIAFLDDRICQACSTRYSPPTPLWAALLIILSGLLLGGIGAVGILEYLMRFHQSGTSSLLRYSFLGVLGIVAIVLGVRGLFTPNKS